MIEYTMTARQVYFQKQTLKRPQISRFVSGHGLGLLNYI